MSDKAFSADTSSSPVEELTLRQLLRREAERSDLGQRHEAREGDQPDDKKEHFTRRGFLAGVTAGSLVLMGNVSATDGDQVFGPALVTEDADDQKSFAPDLFLSIDPDGTVNALVHRSEMGTGIRTGLPRVLADELEADWNRVTIHQARGDKRLGDQNTDGSNSIRFFFKTMRTVGATARTMLERAAAKKWGVKADECVAEKHEVRHLRSEKRLGFGELVPIARTLEIPKPAELKYKPREKWDYIGKSAPIVDLDEIVTGKAVFGIDLRMENQLYAIIARPPVVGGKVKSYDDTKARKMPGVTAIVELPTFEAPCKFQQLGGIAVCANSTWAAWQGRDALKIEWDHGPNSTYDTEQFAKELRATSHQPGKPTRTTGDAEAAFAKADKTITADYSVPHLAHASMEPPAAVADVKTNATGKVVSCHVIAATQNPQAVQDAVGRAMGIPSGEVLVHVSLLGSGFGRKSKPDYCVEAARLSRELKRPVHVTWTREDDLQHDYYHAIASVHCKGALDSDGKPTAWLQRCVYPTITSTFENDAETPANWEAEMGLTDLPYDIPNLQLEVGKAKAHTRIGWLRSVCRIQQVFAVGSFVDELAHAAGRDPYEFLLEVLGADRHLDMAAANMKNRDADFNEYPYDIGRLKNVVRRAAKNSNWTKRGKLPRGRGFGIACCRSFLGYTGHVIEVEVTKKGDVIIPNVWCSMDSGTIVCPDRVDAQVEGAAIMATSQARYGEVKFKKGRSVQYNYNDFKIARMYDSPKKIHVDVVASEAPPAGVGETAVGSFAPALCNAIFAATGVRIRDLPLKNHDLSWS